MQSPSTGIQLRAAIIKNDRCRLNDALATPDQAEEGRTDKSVETSGTYAGHQLVERFLNIWYLMRHGTRRNKQKMRWLVAFLSNFYSRSDLAGIADRKRSYGEAVNERPDYTCAFDKALLLASSKDIANKSSTITSKDVGEYVKKSSTTLPMMKR